MTQSISCLNRPFHRWSGIALSLVLISIAALLPGVRLAAQVQSGINGTVLDSSGRAISGANVSATNTATGAISRSVTSSAGTFIIIGLEPGSYSVSVDSVGFKTVQTTMTVEVAKVSSLDLTMVPGAATETVSVSTASITLDTSSPGIGTTLEPELLASAPIEISGLARQIDSFMDLTPGVQMQGSGGQGIYRTHTINGGITYENDVEFNGVPVAFVDYAGIQTYINPPYEMVNEFRVNSSTFDARYGLGMGSVAYNMASGTNQLHGDAFTILRNQLFDSDGFFPIRYGADGKPEAPVNQETDYGFTIGGPVVLPKLYNGKNRLFFLFSGDWFKQNQAQTAIGTVATPAMKTGDFSNFVDASGNQIPIYDPQTGQPFPGNIIPQSRISPLAQSILPQIPNPDRPGVNFGLQSNKSPAVASLPISQHMWGYTIDYNLSASQNFHFSQWHDYIKTPYFSQAPIVNPKNELQSLINNTNLGTGFLLNYQKIVSKNLVATAGVDAIGNWNPLSDALTGVNFPGVVGGDTFPNVNFDGPNATTGFGTNGGGFVSGFRNRNNRRLGLVFVNNWLWSHGRHTFNFGGEFRRMYQDVLNCIGCGGAFDFSQKQTSTPDSSDPNFGTYGSSFASFLLGTVDSGTRVLSNEIRLRNKAFSFYAQDDIKVTNRLTANVGLRWDIMVPFTEANNQILFVNETEPNPGAGGLPGAETKFGNCTGCAGITRADIHWKNFGPRVGFSYQLNPKTVVQSGFYIVYMVGGAYEFGTVETGLFFTSLLDGEFYRNSTNSSAPGYGNWDQTPMPLPQATPFSPTIGIGDSVVERFRPKAAGTAPYDQSWHVSLQRELPWNAFLKLTYTGNRAIHLPVTLIQSNQPPVSVLQYGNLLGELVNSPDAMAAGIKIPYPEFVQQFGSAATVLQSLAPFPQYALFQNNYEVDGTSFFNALQVQGEKRFSHGLSYLANFMFSRNTANTNTGSAIFSPDAINSYDIRNEYSRSTNDQKYLTNVVATYELPVGPGKKYLNVHGLVGQLVGGWQFSGIVTYAGGYPMGPGNGLNPLLINYYDRPNVVPGVKMKTFNYRLSKQYFTGKLPSQPLQFTTNAFSDTGAWALGDALRSYATLRTPPLRIENFSGIKTFRLFSERARASLRVDYFNAFNRTQLEAPDTNNLDTTFGQINNLSSQITNRQGQATFRVEF